jgi:hypothetical protein
MDELILRVSNLKIDVSYTVTTAGFAVWMSPPLLEHTNASISADRIRETLTRELDLEVTTNELPTLKALAPKVIHVTPFEKILPQEPKPNLLVLLATIFHRLHVEDPTTDSSLIERLHDKFDVLIPRGQLKKMMVESEWEMVACRPLRNGPLYIDRCTSYTTNPGSVGMQFEKAMVDPPKEVYIECML